MTSTFAPRPLGPATLADLQAIPEDDRFHEVVDGELVRKAAPSFAHGVDQARVIGALLPFDRAKGDDGLGGWRFALETVVLFAPNQIFRPDVAGWRRERLAASDTKQWPIAIKPDWVCEVLSPSNRSHDKVRKYRRYAEHGVGHYWLLDPIAGTLEVFGLENGAYQPLLFAERGQLVRAAPFEAIELSISRLLGDDDA